MGWSRRSSEHPDAVRELHREFLDAGAEVLQALAFYGDKEKLVTVGYGDRVGDINRAAVRLAREVAGDLALVAGDLSMTWQYTPDSPAATDRCRALFDEQIEHQMEVGVDFFIGETFLTLGEALLVLERAKRTGLPVMITLSFEDRPTTRDGTRAGECAKVLTGAGADVVGVNCWRGPDQILPLVEEMRSASSWTSRSAPSTP